jgi:pyridoxamine 5'-phosphate oxidase
MKNIIERKEYSRSQFTEADILADPFAQFASWFHDAALAALAVADAAHLATVDNNGHPDGRIVLLKGFDDRGLVFFTNYESTKAAQLKANPFAAVTIYWPELERQIRVRGAVEKTSREESQAYFSSRPRGAQIGAWVSMQSKPIKDRVTLDDAYRAKEQEFIDEEIPCPQNWGGFRLVPNNFEFWQGRDNRLHDRFAFHLKNGSWQRQRLAP